MDLEDSGATAEYLIRDRDAKFPTLFDGILAQAGVQVVLRSIRVPGMNSVMERWVQTCRHELLDRTLTWNQHHVLYALREYETHYSRYRAHQAIQQAAPLHAVSPPITYPQPGHPPTLSGIIHEYEHAADLPGRHCQQTQGRYGVAKAKATLAIAADTRSCTAASFPETACAGVCAEQNQKGDIAAATALFRGRPDRQRDPGRVLERDRLGGAS